MSFKEFITAFYDKVIYLDTKKLSYSKKRLDMQEFHMYVQHCQLLQPREPIKITKCENIMKESRRQLLTPAWNEAKRRLHKSKNRITNICLKHRKIFVSRKLWLQCRRVAEGGATGANAPALRKSCPLYFCPK